MDNLKNLFSIGEVSNICKLPASTIRFWEKEFNDFLSPTYRTKGMQRRYTEKDIGKIIEIKELLHKKGLSIKLVKSILKKKSSDNNYAHYAAVYMAKYFHSIFCEQTEGLK